MAVTYGFYNSLNHDRVYDAEQLSSMFDGFIVDGIFMTIGGQLMVTPGTSGLSVSVASGKAWFNHTWILNDANLQLSLNTAETLFRRIDAVVVEVNTNTRVNSIKVITGTPASTPTAPVLIKDGFVYQYPLAYVNVNANASSITTADVVNKIGSTDCPWITGITEGIDADALYARWEAQWRASMSGMEAWWDNAMKYWTNTFNTSMSNWDTSNTNQQEEFDREFNDWFNSVKGQLSGDLAVQLTNDMVQVKSDISTLNTKVANATSGSYTISVLASNWTGNAAPYTNTVSISGVTASTALSVITLEPSLVGNAAAEAAMQAWSYLDTTNGAVVLYSDTKPTADFTIVAKEVK